MSVPLCFLCLLSLAVGALHCTPVSDQEGELSEPRYTDCPQGWSNYNNRCFRYVASQLDWADAESYCVSLGANLASVNNKGEFSFVKNLIKSFDPAESYTWIGLSDLHKEERWMWSDGSKVVYTIWSSGEPSGSRTENCVQTNYLNDKLWNDAVCSYKSAFVCATRPGL
ncbi:galactose-specific lectin nattectin [Salmo salar]|uniref:Nattectin n=1 Tax=Salmo salar TaxID=8030 RepID=B5XD87_SALSA|nr:galactose-specific lectin nattectin [Salmo salar]ACI68807.1 Nattectin precursor [Salmo salar]|eukprot:XP_014032156.1 PREDICTED: galactose-specific lectin nattectin-like [Salmo salar]